MPRRSPTSSRPSTTSRPTSSNSREAPHAASGAARAAQSVEPGMSKRRVVVTGLGIVSPVGVGIAEAWDTLLAGRSGVAPITRCDASALPTRIAAEVKGFTSADWMPLKETRRNDLFIHFGLAATRLALEDASLVIDDSNGERVGVNVGSGIGGLAVLGGQNPAMVAQGPRPPSPLFAPPTIIN